MRTRKPLPAGEFAARIDDLAEDGRGVARVDGKVTFIAGALPGEAVKFRYTRKRREIDEGEVAAVDEASADRVTPACAHFGVCGGCALQHLSGAGQLKLKQNQLLEVLRRVGKAEPEQIAPALPGPLWHYRRRARLGVKWVGKKNAMLVGFRERDSSFLAQIGSCQVLDARVGLRIEAIAAALAPLSIREHIPQIEVACADHVALVLRVMRPPSEDDLAQLRAFAAREQCELYLQPGGPDSVAPLDAPARTLEFSPDGSALALAFTPTDFMQVNGAVSQAIVRQALEWLGARSGERVLELFCGLGNFSLPLAASGLRVTAVEGEGGLVQRARANAARAGLDIRFEQADLFKTGADAPWLGERYDHVLLDPPRSGAREMLPLIAAAKPRRIVYVSCHPGTLARDADILVHEHGYRLVRAGVMDMFPHTTHIESMALFENAVMPAKTGIQL